MSDERFKRDSEYVKGIEWWELLPGGFIIIGLALLAN